MPPDSAALIRKFIPNNHKLAKAVQTVSDRTFKARFLPMQLVKLLVDRALDLTRLDIDPESKIFEDKLTEYARQIMPRFRSKIMELQRGKGGFRGR